MKMDFRFHKKSEQLALMPLHPCIIPFFLKPVLCLYINIVYYVIIFLSIILQLKFSSFVILKIK